MDLSGSASVKNLLYGAGLVFSAAGSVLAGLLICKHLYPDLCAQGSFGCTVGGTDGCAHLGRHEYSRIFGIPLAVPGFLYYVFVFLLFLEAFRQKNRAARYPLLVLLAGLASFGIILDLILGYINFFRLDTPCMLCAYSYIATAGIGVSALALYFTEKKPDAAG